MNLSLSLSLSLSPLSLNHRRWKHFGSGEAKEGGALGTLSMIVIKNLLLKSIIRNQPQKWGGHGCPSLPSSCATVFTPSLPPSLPLSLSLSLSLLPLFSLTLNFLSPSWLSLSHLSRLSHSLSSIYVPGQAPPLECWHEKDWSNPPVYHQPSL